MYSFRGRSAGFSVTRYLLVGGLLGMEGFNQVRYHKHVAVGWLFHLCMTAKFDNVHGM